MSGSAWEDVIWWLLLLLSVLLALLRLITGPAQAWSARMFTGALLLLLLWGCLCEACGEMLRITILRFSADNTNMAAGEIAVLSYAARFPIALLQGLLGAFAFRWVLSLSFVNSLFVSMIVSGLPTLAILLRIHGFW